LPCARCARRRSGDARPNPLLTAFAILIYAFLFAPIVVLIIFSFNVSRRNFVWLGFTTDWYPKLFANGDLLDALWVTVQVAAIAVIVSTVLGSFLGLALARNRFRGAGSAEV
jgi:ABC-type spermidine/putrescine transport system permease subunit II